MSELTLHPLRRTPRFKTNPCERGAERMEGLRGRPSLPTSGIPAPFIACLRSRVRWSPFTHPRSVWKIGSSRGRTPTRATQSSNALRAGGIRYTSRGSWSLVPVTSPVAVSLPPNRTCRIPRVRSRSAQVAWISSPRRQPVVAAALQIAT
jgi:hypothetical protein